MNWITLIVAGLFEAGFTTSLGKAKETTGMTSYLWYGSFALCLTISLVLLIKATQTLPLGTAYAVWTGIGAVGIVLMGLLFFSEPATLWRLIFVTTLVGSIIGLKVVASH